jgi:hypothetical protein
MTELVALLHRADWTRLCLSGEVSGIEEFESAAPPTRLTRLLVAPGKRYRKDSLDGQFARGCDRGAPLGVVAVPAT